MISSQFAVQIQRYGSLGREGKWELELECGSVMKSFHFMFSKTMGSSRAWHSCSCQKPVPAGSLLQSRRLSAPCGFSKQNPPYRRPRVWRGSPGCPQLVLPAGLPCPSKMWTGLHHCWLQSSPRQTVLRQTRSDCLLNFISCSVAQLKLLIVSDMDPTFITHVSL